MMILFFIIFFAVGIVKGSGCPPCIHSMQWESAPTSCALMDKGLSYDHVYLVRFSDDRSVVVKLLNDTRSMQSKKTTLLVSQFTGEKDWGPKMLWHASDAGLFVMEFLHASTVHGISGKEKQLGAFLKTIHAALNARDFSIIISRYSMYDRALHRLEELKRQNFLSAADIKKTEELLAILHAKENRKDVAVLHNDIKPTNLFQSKDVFKLLDWGESSISSVYDELGAVAFYFDLSEKQIEALLQGYWAHSPTKQEISDVKVHADLVALHFALWCIRRGGEVCPVPISSKANFEGIKKHILQNYSQSISKKTLSWGGCSLLHSILYR